MVTTLADAQMDTDTLLQQIQMVSLVTAQNADHTSIFPTHLESRQAAGNASGTKSQLEITQLVNV